MAYTVQDLKNDLTGVLHGTTLNQITNLDGLIYRAARKLLLDVDPQETIRQVPFSTPIFNQIYTYAIPNDLKGISVIDIKPQVNRTFADVYNQDYSQQFDLSKTLQIASQFEVNFNTGIKTININAPFVTPPIITNTANGVTTNGTWAVGGDAQNLETDYVNWVQDGGSLQFDLSGVGTSGYLENSTMTATDLTTHLNQAYEFLWTYLPTGSAFTSVAFRWGSSSSDYYSATATLNQQGDDFINGWNTTQYIWNDASVTGSPDPASITYMRVTWVYDGTPQTAVRLNYITSQLGSILNCVYYSKYLFRDASTGAFQEKVTDNANIINLDVESYNLLTYQVAYLASQQQQGVNALQYDGQFFLNQYNEGVVKYKARYKSQIQKPRQFYYQKPSPNYWNRVGGWWWGAGN